MAPRTPWILAGTVTLAAAGVAGVSYLRRTSEPPHHPPAPAVSASATQAPEAPPPPPSAEELALIAPLGVGSDLAGFKVERVIGVRGGVLRLVCVKDKATVRLDVALADEEGAVPPATAGKYAVFYSLGAALPEEGDRLAQGLAAVLKAHADMTPPAGMTKFTPKEKPGVAL